MPAKRSKSVRQVKAVTYDPEPMLEALGKALTRLKKAELVDAMVALARRDADLLRVMERRFDVRLPALAVNKTNLKTIVQATRMAIAKATDFDKRRMGHNFDYDSRAYETVQRNLEQLIKARQFEPVTELAVELMQKGSYQIEMSDEGMMTEDVEDCMRPVIHGLIKSGLPQAKADSMLEELQSADRNGYICRKEFRAR